MWNVENRDPEFCVEMFIKQEMKPEEEEDFIKIEPKCEDVYKTESDNMQCFGNVMR